MPEMKMEIDIEAVIPQTSAHRRLRIFNTRDWFNQAIDRDSCMVVQTDDEIYLRGQTGAQLDGRRMVGLGRTPEDAAPRPTRRCKTPDGSSTKPDRAWRRCASSVSTLAIAPIGSQSIRCLADTLAMCIPVPRVLSCAALPVQKSCVKSIWPSPAPTAHRISVCVASRPVNSTKTARICVASSAWPYALAIVSICGPDREYIGRRVRW